MERRLSAWLELDPTHSPFRRGFEGATLLIIWALLLSRASLDSVSLNLILFPGTALQINLIGLLNLAMIGLAVAFWIICRPPRPRALMTVPWLLFLGMALVSSLFSPDRMDSIRDWTRVAAPAAAFYLTLPLLRTRARWTRTLRIALLSAVVPLGVSAVQLFTDSGFHVQVGLNRIHGTFWHPAGLAMYLLIFALAPLPLFAKRRGKLVGIGAGLIAAASVAATVITLSRTAWAALAVGLVVCLLLQLRIRWFAPLVLAGVAVGVGVIVCQTPLVQFQKLMRYMALANAGTATPAPGLAGATDIPAATRTPGQASSTVVRVATPVPVRTATPATAARRLSEIFSTDVEAVPVPGDPNYHWGVANMGAENTFHWRILLWRQTLPFFFRKPILGNGFGRFNELAATTSLGIQDAAHNDYLRIAVEMGAVGLLLYLALFAALLWSVWRLIGDRARATERRTMAAAFLAVGLALLAFSLADNVLSYHTPLWYFWTFAAIVLAPASTDRAVEEA